MNEFSYFMLFDIFSIDGYITLKTIGKKSCSECSDRSVIVNITRGFGVQFRVWFKALCTHCGTLHIDPVKVHSCS